MGSSGDLIQSEGVPVLSGVHQDSVDVNCLDGSIGLNDDIEHIVIEADKDSLSILGQGLFYCSVNDFEVMAVLGDRVSVCVKDRGDLSIDNGCLESVHGVGGVSVSVDGEPESILDDDIEVLEVLDDLRVD